VSRLCRELGSLDLSEPCGPPWPVAGIALPFYLYRSKYDCGCVMRMRVYMHSYHLWRYSSSVLFNVPGEGTEQVSSCDKAPHLCKKYQDSLSAGNFPRFTLELERGDRHRMHAARDSSSWHEATCLIASEGNAEANIVPAGRPCLTSPLLRQMSMKHDAVMTVMHTLNYSCSKISPSFVDRCPARRGTRRAMKITKL
jgi:hypothetical protein